MGCLEAAGSPSGRDVQVARTTGGAAVGLFPLLWVLVGPWSARGFGAPGKGLVSKSSSCLFIAGWWFGGRALGEPALPSPLGCCGALGNWLRARLHLRAGFSACCSLPTQRPQRPERHQLCRVSKAGGTSWELVPDRAELGGWLRGAAALPQRPGGPAWPRALGQRCLCTPLALVMPVSAAWYQSTRRARRPAWPGEVEQARRPRYQLE